MPQRFLDAVTGRGGNPNTPFRSAGAGRASNPFTRFAAGAGQPGAMAQQERAHQRRGGEQTAQIRAALMQAMQRGMGPQAAMLALANTPEFMEAMASPDVDFGGMMEELQDIATGQRREEAIAGLDPELQRAVALDPTGAPPTIAERLIGSKLPEPMTIFQSAQVAQAQRSFEESVRQFGLKHGLDVAKFELEVYKSMQPDLGQAAGLRKEFTADVRQPIRAAESFQRVTESIRLRTDAGDAAAGLAFMQMVDPAVTRLSAAGVDDLETVGAIDQRLAGILRRVIFGERLTDRARADLLEASAALAQPQLDQFDRRRELFSRLARTQGFDPDLAVPDLLGPEVRSTLREVIREVEVDREPLPSPRTIMREGRQPGLMDRMGERLSAPREGTPADAPADALDDVRTALVTADPAAARAAVDARSDEELAALPPDVLDRLMHILEGG